MSAPYTKLASPIDEYAMLCRGCLAESGEMKNMFDWGLAEEFTKFTDLQITKACGLSELLCSDCEGTLISCRRFKEKCQNADRVLQTTVKQKQSEQNNISQENTVTSVMCEKKLMFQITAPNADEKIYLGCPYCHNRYIKQKDLYLHLDRTHQIGKEKIDIELQYYCSFDKCSYHIKSGVNKYFLARKFLNQHHHKVHMPKTFQCIACTASFPSSSALKRHYKECNTTYVCQICNSFYRSNERLLVHLLRKHPNEHKQYKEQKRNSRLKGEPEIGGKRLKIEEKHDWAICDSPKRSFATQTLKPEENIRNDVALPSWNVQKQDAYETKTDEISTQTVFEDLLSLKSQTSEDDSIFFSETVSLTDIQTQTFPIEFGLSRSNKETITSETQSPDLSIKETQTCYCLYDSPKINFRLFDSFNSSPNNLTSTETQTAVTEFESAVRTDVLLNFNSAQTQTSFEECLNKDSL